MKTIVPMIFLFVLMPLFSIRKAFLSNFNNLPSVYEEEFCRKEKTLSCGLFDDFKKGMMPTIKIGQTVTLCHIYAGSTYLYENLFLILLFRKQGSEIQISSSFLVPKNEREVTRSVFLINSIRGNQTLYSSPLMKFLQQNANSEPYTKATPSKNELTAPDPYLQSLNKVHIRVYKENLILLKLGRYPSPSSFDGNLDTVLAQCPLPTDLYP